MEARTTIRKMLAGNYISVPKYQRAYAWDSDKQVKQFLQDIDDYIASKSETPYYFGHFLFENLKSDGDNFDIIDGQQRLTTIEFFLSAVFARLASIRALSDDEEDVKEDMLKRKSRYRFATVEYDNPFFKDYVIDQTKKNKDNIETLSAERLAVAFDFFTEKLASKSENELLEYINCIASAVCTTHIVNAEAEAIQMFIFQNNRGKKPTKLEVIKAQFMYELHLSALEEDEKSAKLKELQERFEHIYKSIATIESHIDEDDVILYALRVYFNTFDIDVSTEKIEQQLKKKASAIDFIMSFTFELERSFESLKPFFAENKTYEIYSLALLGKTQMMPFVIKAYEFGVSTEDKASLFAALESLVLRHRIIGTRAHLEDRIKDYYRKFTKENSDVTPIVEHIRWLETMTENWAWWKYWSNDSFKDHLQGFIDHKIAKHLLWKYENFLLKQQKSGYNFMPFSQIEKPELEHIAPQTPTNNEPVAAGYAQYDEDFAENYLDCLGNYLLISKSHNCSIGNVPFAEKRASYSVLLQQREVQDMTKDSPIWDKDKIDARHENLVDFVISKI